MNILWISHLIPYPPKGGVLQRSYNLIKEVAKHHNVHLLAFNQRALLTTRHIGAAVGPCSAERSAHNARPQAESRSWLRTVRPARVFGLREGSYSPLQKGGDPAAGSPTATLLRLRPSHRARLRPLPPLRVSTRTSGAPDFHGVTGGVYKARERIHRGVADPRLLAIPASRRRVAACDPNLDRFSGIRSPSRVRRPLYRPL